MKHAGVVLLSLLLTTACTKRPAVVESLLGYLVTGPITIPSPPPERLSAQLKFSLNGRDIDGPISFGRHFLGARGERWITITNTGRAEATSISAGVASNVFGFKDWAYPGNGGDCGSSLPAKSSCSVALAFAPAELGEASAPMTLRYHDGSEMIETQVSLSGRGSRIVSLVPGPSHSCAIYEEGDMACWGSNAHRQLAMEQKSSRVTTPSRVHLPDRVAMISSGQSHTCSLLGDSTVYCWGGNESGESGDENVGDDHADPVPIRLGRRAVSISTGVHHSCAVLEDGGIECWGINLLGQLGNALAGGSIMPVPVMGIQNAIAIGSGDNHSCAVLASGEVYCWGANDSGQLATSESLGGSQFTPVAVPVNGANRVIAGAAHSCAVQEDGKVYCWGSNRSGQLGTGDFQDRVEPGLVGGLKWIGSAAAGGDNTCAINTAGTLKCWGANDRGQLGIGETGAARPSPVEFWSSSDSLVVGVGNTNICSFGEDGRIECAGDASSGQFGEGYTDPVTEPVPLELSPPAD